MLLITRNYELKKAGDFEYLLWDGGTEWKMMYLRKNFFSDDERYADLINGLGCDGKQIVRKEDLQELDTQTGILKSSFHRKRERRVGRSARFT